MEIPMQDIVNSYRQQLSDSIHKNTIQELHITRLKKELAKNTIRIQELQAVVDQYEPTRIEEHYDDTT